MESQPGCVFEGWELMLAVFVWLSAAVRWLITTLGYSGIALVMFLETIFPPIPTDAILPFAGFMAARGQINFWLVLLVATAGRTLGSLVYYFLGRRIPEESMRRFLRRWGRYVFLQERDFERVVYFFQRFGDPIVFTARFLPVIRSLISIPAGMFRMSLGRFVVFTLAGVGIWNLGGELLGFYMGRHWGRILGMVESVGKWLIVIILLALAVYLFLHRWLVQRLAGSGEQTGPS
jgi:membrane protein DedA with SNARE-associated domain